LHRDQERFQQAMDAIDQRRHMTTVNMQENCNLNDQYQNSLRAAANVEFGTSLQ